MKKFLLFFFLTIHFNLFSQSYRFIIFKKSLKENKTWIYQNQPCQIGLNFNESSIKLESDVYDFWEILKSYPIQVNGKINSIDYDCKDLSGNYLKIIITSNDLTPDEATLTIIYPNKTLIFDFKEN